MYLVRNSFHISFKWVVITSTKQEVAHTQSAKVSTCYTLWHFGDWSLITGREWLQTAGGGGGVSEVLSLQRGGAETFLAVLKGGGGSLKFEP